MAQPHWPLGERRSARPGFDFTYHMRRLCQHLTAELPELGHIDLEKVAVRFCQVRKAVKHGMLASLTPLRFQHGSQFTVRRGRRWRIETVHDAAGREMLYLLSFYLPRFCDYPFQEKLSTVVHELWHIGPEFDGDLRRHPGRCYAHSPRQKDFDAHADALAQKWLSQSPPPEVYAFLQASFRELVQQHGTVIGHRIRTPRIVRTDG
jgi:hypothetical protein